MYRTLVAALVCLSAAPAAMAARAEDKAAPEKMLEETQMVTRHSMVIEGQTVQYRAEAGTYILKDDEDKQQASIFYVSYTKEGVEDKSSRPLFISFNGGPGSASVWMHMGFTGPRRVVYDEEGFMPQPPFRLEDNPHSILDIADIVYIDPAATGYSRMAPGQEPHKFHGVMEDIQSVAEFIRLFVTRNERWDSPKFLIGESYGTTRASGLAGYLQSRHRMYLNGVILVSMTDLNFEKGDDVGFATCLPHFTATAWYHKALDAGLQSKPLRTVLQEAEDFAMGEYLSALVKGDRLSAVERRAVADKAAHYTGLSSEYILKADLRVDRGRFRKELLRDRGITVGRLDSRYTGIDKDEAGETYEFDPAMEAWNGPFTAVINSYFRDTLDYRTDLEYNIFGDVRPWNRSGNTNVGQMLRGAMTQNPYLRVLILAGYYDGATDYCAAQYTISHLDPGGQLKDRFRFALYESGHMMYLRNADLAKCKKDIAAFVQSAVPAS